MPKKTARNLIFHPLLFAIYPVLALLAANLDQVAAHTALRAGLISLAGGALLYLILNLLLHDRAKAAALASLWLVLFFSYGHFYQIIEGKALAGVVIGKHRYLIIIWLAIFAAGSAWVIKKLSQARELNLVLNAISAVLVLFPLVQVSTFAYRELRAQSPVPRIAQETGQSAVQPDAGQAGTPDVYYIILDGYSRADIMKDLYDLDITPFMEELKTLGFVFPDCAQSNYGITAFSMFASLNMDYLDAYGSAFPLGSEMEKVDYQSMREFLVNSRVREVFHEKGYQMITFETGFWWLNIGDSDQYIVENNNPLKKYSKSYSLSNFEDLFIRTTALRLLTEANTAFLGSLTQRVKTPEQQHYEWVEFALDQLSAIPEIPGKKFVYFHVLAPHDPFVFAPDGSYHHYPNSESDLPGYPNEVEYLNKRVVDIVRSLIASSDTPPVIIIQGDHGWDPRYRMQILNAYYLPGASEKVYSTITPVNTFRLILDTYFGENYDLLPDASYYSMGSDFPQYGIRSRPYQLTPVPSTCMNSAQ